MPGLGLGYSVRDSQDQGGSLRNVNLHVRAKVASLVSNSSQPCGLYSLPGSSVHGISEARILEWVAISFSRGSSQPRNPNHISYIFCLSRQGSLSHHGSPNALIFAFKTGTGNMKNNNTSFKWVIEVKKLKEKMSIICPS